MKQVLVNNGQLLGRSSTAFVRPTPPPFNIYSTGVDGTGDELDVANHSDYIFDISGDNNFSMIGWFKPTNFTPGGNYAPVVFGKGGGSVRGFRLHTKTNEGNILLLNLANSGSNNITYRSSYSLSINTWHMVGVVFNGSSGKIVYNGNLDNPVGTQNGSGISNGISTTEEIAIGYPSPAYANHVRSVGSFDEITWWNNVLSSDDIVELYNGGSPIVPTTHLAASKLVSWWRMGDNDTSPNIIDHVSGHTMITTNMDQTNFITDVPS